MKKILFSLLTALALLATGCSGSSDDGNKPKPIAPGTEARPDWTAPYAQNYAQNMTVYLHPQAVLLPYVTAADMVCATINGEVRGVGMPVRDGDEWLIPLVVFSDGAAPIQLSYYCDQLHRIFTISWTTFDSSLPPVGTGVIYTPPFCQ